MHPLLAQALVFLETSRHSRLGLTQTHLPLVSYFFFSIHGIKLNQNFGDWQHFTCVHLQFHIYFFISLLIATSGVFQGFGGTATGGSLFGNKTATTGLGTGLGTGFGAGMCPCICFFFFFCNVMLLKEPELNFFSLTTAATGQTSLFGNNQNKLGSTLGSVGTFGAGTFNTGTSTLNFGAPQQPVGQYEDINLQISLLA